MATSLIAKSALRKNNNISVGYGEVPAISSHRGQTIWGLPNGERTRDIEIARAYAAQLDEMIRRNMRSVGDLMVAKG